MRRTTIIVILLILPATGWAEDVISGRFELVDHNGAQVTERSYDGQLRLVFFGFTQCPDVCPLTLVEIRNALRELGDDANEVQTLFIGIDRENDTQENLARYVSAFHPSIVGLTGTEDQLRAAAESFNVTYGVNTAEQSVSGRAEIFHSSYVFLMDREGRLLDVLGYGTSALRIAKRLRHYL